MSAFADIYHILWSVLAIAGGILLLFFREKFIQGTERGFGRWYEKTGFFLFRLQAENTNSVYMRIITVSVAIILIVVGVLTMTSAT